MAINDTSTISQRTSISAILVFAYVFIQYLCRYSYTSTTFGSVEDESDLSWLRYARTSSLDANGIPKILWNSVDKSPPYIENNAGLDEKPEGA